MADIQIYDEPLRIAVLRIVGFPGDRQLAGALLVKSNRHPSWRRLAAELQGLRNEFPESNAGTTALAYFDEFSSSISTTQIRGFVFADKSRVAFYTVILEQEPDNGFVAIVPALPGWVSQGDTREQVMANIREAIEFYIEDCVAAGDPVPTEVGKEFVEVPSPR